MTKRFLVVGHVARDHALAWKLSQSPLTEAVHVHTGNMAMTFDQNLIFVSERSIAELAEYAIENKIDCTLVGDTSCMEDGIVDTFSRLGLPILGAPQVSAQLEGSKLFGKNFMHRHGVPTARHSTCSNPMDARAFLDECSYPAVLKSDLRVASNISVVIAQNEAEAAQAYKSIFFGQMKKKSHNVILEEFVVGREISYTILMDGTDWIPLAAVRDYKRLGDADEGPNTGGMGSYAPVSWLTPDMEAQIKEKVVLPTLRGMQAEGLQYRGFLYFGLMIDADGAPWLLEYNTRLGDTEAETILMLLEDDIAELAMRAANGSIRNMDINWRDGYAMSVTLAPEGYPAAPVRTRLDLPFPTHEEVKCFGSIIGMTEGGDYRTGNGRVACVTGYAKNAAACRDVVYGIVKQVNKDGLFLSRSDIGLEVVK